MPRLKDILKRPLLGAITRLGRRIGYRFDRPVQPRRLSRALVIQLGGIGDILRVFPVIERLQCAFPDGEVGLFTNQGAALLDLYPGSRRPLCVGFDLAWGYSRKLRELALLRRAGFDLVINPTRGDGMLECAVIAWLTGAPHRIGFEQDGAGFLHTCKISFSEDVSILEQNLGLLKPLGIDPGELRQRIRIPHSAKTHAADWYARHVPAGRKRIVIHPWASSHSEFRAWPIAKYVAMIATLLHQRDAAVVVLGSESEAAPDRPLLSTLPVERVHDLTGMTSLTQAAAFIAACDLFIGNDSGLLHMALAADVPVVAVFGATPPSQLLPSNDHVVPVVAGFPCQPCYRHQPLFDYRCDYGFRCLNHLSVESVLREVLRLTA